MNIVIKVILICFICLNMLVNMMMLGLKSGPQIAAKTGIPAGLLFRRIWYSVWKSGVLGITEYRQGRPLIFVCVAMNLETNLNISEIITNFPMSMNNCLQCSQCKFSFVLIYCNYMGIFFVKHLKVFCLIGSKPTAYIE